MKFLRSAVVSLLALGCVSLVSCSKEDGKGSGEPGGSFTVDGKAYKVAKAYMTYYGEKGAAENRWGHVDLWFDFDESGNQESGVELDFAVPEGAAKLTAGTYPYDMDGDTPAPCYFDGDVWDDDLDLSGTIAKGRVIVSVSGILIPSVWKTASSSPTTLRHKSERYPVRIRGRCCMTITIIRRNQRSERTH